MQRKFKVYHTSAALSARQDTERMKYSEMIFYDNTQIKIKGEGKSQSLHGPNKAPVDPSHIQ